MVRTTFAIIFLVLTIVMAVFFFVCFFKKNKRDLFGRHIGVLALLTSFMNLFISLSFFVKDVKLYSIFTSLWYAVSPWIIMMFLKLIVNYVNIKQRYQYGVTYVILGINSAMFIANAFYNYMMPWEVISKFGETFFRITNHYWIIPHMVISYIFIIFTLIITYYEAFKATRINRSKYIVFSMDITLGVIYNIIFNVLHKDMVLDMTPIFYNLVVLSVACYNLFVNPKTLGNKVKTLLVDGSNDGFIVFDEYKNFFLCNKTADEVFSNHSIHRGYDHFLKLINEDKPVDGQEVLYSKPCGEGKCYYKIIPSKFYDTKERIQAYYFEIQNITAEMVRLKEKEYHERHDTLTGLYNRNYFLELSKMIVESHSDDSYYVIATNFKQFRLFNDTYGLEAGDKLLLDFASRLHMLSKSYPMIYCRMGSDHFCILISKETFTKASFPELLIETCKEYEEYNVKIVLGIAEVKKSNIDTAFDRSILTIHNFKKDLNQRFGYYNSEIKQKMIRENTLLKEFDSSLRNDHFKIYFQPQVNSRDDSIFGAEALVRWEHPKLGLIEPTEFIPLFERSNLITRLDTYVWEKVFSYLHDCQKKNINNLSLSINISRLDFYRINIVSTLLDLVIKYDVKPSKVKLEITESVFLNDENRITTILKELQQKGFIIQMDDFGSGYSSLNILRFIPIDVIKLDMKFLSDYHDDYRTKEVLNSIISMSHRLRLPVIAEGVETEEQVNLLRNMNCELIQGFYYAKPLKEKEFQIFLTKHRVLPYLNHLIIENRSLYPLYKEIDKYYGSYPYPIIVLEPLYNEQKKLYDLTCIYQNKYFEQTDDIKLGNIVGKKVSELPDGLANNRIETYRRLLEEKESLIYNDRQIGDTIFEIDLYCIPDSNLVSILFRPTSKK